ncbi:MAG TPA: heavy metal translocating P-type ATPase [Candidatus Bathyarchaeia archaeon]|nr:heavy metal translocating P-type ATPase [Candidatus Bathyarchaeia archaeon]
MREQEVILQILGMHCTACATGIESGLRRLDGVIEANVNFATKEAVVRFDEDKVTLDRIKASVKRGGYEAVERVEDVTEKRRKEIRGKLRLFFFGLGLTIPILVIAYLLTFSGKNYVLLVLATPVQFVVGWHFYQGAYSSIRNRFADMNVLVALSSSVAYVYSVYISFFTTNGTGFFEASAVVITTITLGMVLEDMAVERTGDAIKKLMAIQPKKAVIIQDGQEKEIAAGDVQIGDTVIVKPGDRIPVDGTITDGHTYIDESMITGESFPVEKNVGDAVFSGTINKTGTLKFRAEKIGLETMLASIVRLAREVQASKAPVQRLADKVVNVFVPAVVGISIITFCVWFFAFHNQNLALTTTVAVLAISCPCALGIATPAAIMIGVGKGAENGVLIKNSAVLESAKNIDTVVFDKTGTLTKGRLDVPDIVAKDKKTTLEVAAVAEKWSEHPIGQAIVRKAESEGILVADPESFEALPGFGVMAEFKGKKTLIGNPALMRNNEISIAKLKGQIEKLEGEGKTVVIIALEGKAVGVLAVSDTVKENAKEAVSTLQKMGLRVVMLSGDAKRTAEAIAKQTGINEILAEVAPSQKVEQIKELQAEGHFVAMVGDGINDAPAITQANVGIAIGGGTDVAVDSGDIVLIKDDPKDVATSIKLGRKTWGKIKQNLFWAFFYNVIMIPLAAGVLHPLFGILIPPEAAATSMILSDITVVGNSMLLRRFKP